jgi:predicted kinase
MKKLIIMRGLPGSGKSHYIKKFFRGRMTGSLDSTHPIICSADHFFMVGDKYHFDVKYLGQAHAECQVKCLNLMKVSHPHIIIDNTNSQEWEFITYLAMARALNYEVEVIRVGDRVDDNKSVSKYAERNTHGVPEETIRDMADRWEDYHGEKVVS